MVIDWFCYLKFHYSRAANNPEKTVIRRGEPYPSGTPFFLSPIPGKQGAGRFSPCHIPGKWGVKC